MAEYIERENVIGILKDYCKITCAHYPSERDIYCGMCGTGDIIGIIKAMPSADVIPAPTTTFISGLVIGEVDDG